MNSEELETKTQAVFVAMAALANEYDANRPCQPWYDHRYDWLRGPENWTRLERIVYGGRYVLSNSDVLDLCCGDGFVAYCMALRARIVHGLDIDQEALAHARQHYGKGTPGLDFFHCDIAANHFPQAAYDVVLWFDGLAYLTREEGQTVLKRIRECLPATGVMVGSTPLIPAGRISNPLSGNKHQIFSIAELQSFLSPFFKRIEIWRSYWGNRNERGGRTQLYFVCEKAAVW